MAGSNQTPFTIIDGVPRLILATALENAARSVLTDAHQNLVNAARDALATTQTGRLPELEQIDAAIAKLAAARELYAEQRDVAAGIYTQARELREDAEPEGSAA